MRLNPTLGCVISGLLIALPMAMTTAEASEEPTFKAVDQAIVVDSSREPSRSGTRPEVLKLLLKQTPKPNYDAAVPARISGRVVLHARGTTVGAEGVSVTDGYSVVKTDARGAYALTPDPSAVFVYITRPTQCDVQGDWYKPLAAKVDFALKPAAGDENDYIFVHVTDTHISENPRSVAGLSRFVREVNALTPKPRFVVNSGDLLNLHKALLGTPATGHASFRNYVGIMNHLTMPHYAVAGDHTDSSYRLEEFPRGDHRCGKPMYWEYLGPHFFSFEYGKIHFVSVDFGYHLGQRQILVNGQNVEYPTNGVRPMHVEWMKQDMASRTTGSFVVTTAESDLTQFCPGFLEIAKRHDVRLQLVGDDHIVSYKARPVPYRTGGALSGCWWNPKARQLCPDLSPQGYLIYRVTGEKLDCFYKGLGQRVVMVSHRVGAAWKGRVKVQAHVVQPQPNETLEYTLNGKDWKAMQEIGRPFYRALHEAIVDSTSLSDGFLRFSVRSTASGEVCSRVFVVVNGDDSSAFEADASLTFTVSPANGWTPPRAPTGKVDVLFNGKAIGALQPKVGKEYVFRIPATNLRKANTLSFRFLEPGDGMSLSSPVLTFEGKAFRDPRDEAIRQVRTGHWGDKAADWGGFIAGDAQPPDETPFHRRQNVFCFVFSGAE
jgi:calcineurin-like phosphoesterase family protein